MITHSSQLRRYVTHQHIESSYSASFCEKNIHSGSKGGNRGGACQLVNSRLALWVRWNMKGLHGYVRITATLINSDTINTYYGSDLIHNYVSRTSLLWLQQPPRMSLPQTKTVYACLWGHYEVGDCVCVSCWLTCCYDALRCYLRVWFTYHIPILICVVSILLFQCFKADGSDGISEPAYLLLLTSDLMTHLITQIYLSSGVCKCSSPLLKGAWTIWLLYNFKSSTKKLDRTSRLDIKFHWSHKPK